MQCKKTLLLGWRQDGDVHQVRSEFACTSREDPADRASVLAAVAVAEFCFLSLAHSVKMLALWRTSPYPVPLKAAEKDGRILLVLVLWLFFFRTSLTGVLGVFLFPHFNCVACFHFLALASFTFGASLRSTWYGKNVHAYTNWGVRHTGRQTHWRHTKWAGVCQAVVVYLIYVTTITTTAGVCILHKYVHTPTTPLVMHTAWTVATVRFTEPLQLHLLVAFLLLFLLLSSYEWRKRCFFFHLYRPPWVHWFHIQAIRVCLRIAYYFSLESNEWCCVLNFNVWVITATFQRCYIKHYTQHVFKRYLEKVLSAYYYTLTHFFEH